MSLVCLNEKMAASFGASQDYASYLIVDRVNIWALDDRSPGFLEVGTSLSLDILGRDHNGGCLFPILTESGVLGLSRSCDNLRKIVVLKEQQ